MFVYSRDDEFLQMSQKETKDPEKKSADSSENKYAKKQADDDYYDSDESFNRALQMEIEGGKPNKSQR